MIKLKPLLNTFITYTDIERIYPYNYKYYVNLGKEQACIVSNYEINPRMLDVVSCVDSVKVPLWKQDMDLRMGKRVQPYKENCRNYRVRFIPLDNLFNYRYKVYCVQ